MPELDWIGKQAVVNHHHAVPFRLLEDVPDYLEIEAVFQSLPGGS